MENQSPKGNKPQPAKLYDLQIVLSARMNQTILRGVHYAIAVAKKKSLIAYGNVIRRQIWIIPHSSENNKTIVRK